MKKFFGGIYFQLIALFLAILILSLMVPIGTIFFVESDSIRSDVETQLLERATVIQGLIVDENLSPSVALSYFGNILVETRELEPAVIAERLSPEEHAALRKGEIVLHPRSGTPGLPVAYLAVHEQFIIVFPNLRNNAISKYGRLFQLCIIAPVIAGLLLILVVGMVFTRSVKRLSIASVKVASGDFDAEIPESKRSMGEMSELVRNFNRMVRQLSANEYLHRDFVSSVSHEFKTPITSLRGYAKLLRRGDLPETKRAEYLEIIIEESERLSELSTNLLRLSELDSAEIVIERVGFSLSEQIRRTALLLQSSWEAKQQEMVFDLEDVQFVGDEGLLSHVWINLISNAITFTPKGGTIRVTLSAGDEIAVVIEDNGIGIAEEDLSNIFTRFYKADRSRATRGNGLGLTIVKRIIECHGGDIFVSSTVGEGSRFEVRLQTSRRSAPH